MNIERSKDSDTVQRISYEEAVERYGTGRYQLILCCLLSLVTWSTTTGNEGYVWIGAKMSQSCQPTDHTDVNSSAVLYAVDKNQCTYSIRTTDEIKNDTEITLHSDVICTKWSYDKSFFNSTIMSEWDLNECNGKWKISLAASIYMIGFLVGCFLFGDLSDRFGRRNMFLLSHIGLVASGIAAAYSVNLEMLIALRCLFGVFVAGARNSGFVYMAEILNPKYRSLTGPVTSITYCIFAVLNVAIMQYTRDWRMFTLITALGCLWFIPYWFFFYESPHWLLAQGRQEEVVKYFRRSAQVNNVEILGRFEIYHHSSVMEKKKTNFSDFVKKANIRFISIVVCFSWFFVSFVAFGFSYNIGNMSGNMYHNAYISWSCAPLLVFSIILMRHGRRLTVVFGFFAILLMSIAMAILTSYQHLAGVTNYVMPVLCALGRILASFCFSALYVLTSEIYAVKMRVSAVGLGSSFSRVGGAVAPYIALSGDIWPNLPYILISVASLIAGVFCMALPETLNQNLPETVDDMSKQYSLYSLYSKCSQDSDRSKDDED